VTRATEEVEAACEARVSEVREHQRAAERRLAAALEQTRHAQEAVDRAQSRLFEVSSAAEGRIGSLQVPAHSMMLLIFCRMVLFMWRILLML
jgi:hypothetical protein